MLAGDLLHVRVHERSAAHDGLARRRSSVSTRCGPLRTRFATRSSAPPNSSPSVAPDRDVGALSRLERADVVAPQHGRTAARRQPQAPRAPQRAAPAAAARHEQRLLHLEEEIAALVRGGPVDAEADADAGVEQLADRRDARSEPQVRASGSARRRRRRVPNVATSSAGEMDAVRAPDVVVEPADALEVLDRRAAEELAAVGVLLARLREVRVQLQRRAAVRARPTPPSACVVTENGEHGATTICTRSPSASPASRSVSARIVVEVSRPASPAAGRRPTRRGPSSRARRRSAARARAPPAARPRRGPTRRAGRRSGGRTRSSSPTAPARRARCARRRTPSRRRAAPTPDRASSAR